MISDEGNFEEIRDGRHTTVAYESPDDIHYMVETFSWDRNPAGGVEKKNLRQSWYELGGDGKMKATEAP